VGQIVCGEDPSQRLIDPVGEPPQDVGPRVDLSPVTSSSQGTARSRSVSERLQTTSLGVPEHFNCKWDSRSKTSTVAHDVGHTSGRSQTFRPIQPIRFPEYLPVTANPRLPYGVSGVATFDNGKWSVPTTPDEPNPIAPRPILPLTIHLTPGGPISGPRSGSPPHAPWYTPQPPPYPHPQLGPDFPSVSHHCRIERKVTLMMWYNLGCTLPSLFQSRELACTRYRSWWQW